MQGQCLMTGCSLCCKDTHCLVICSPHAPLETLSVWTSHILSHPACGGRWWLNTWTAFYSLRPDSLVVTFCSQGLGRLFAKNTFHFQHICFCLVHLFSRSNSTSNLWPSITILGASFGYLNTGDWGSNPEGHIGSLRAEAVTSVQFVKIHLRQIIISDFGLYKWNVIFIWFQLFAPLPFKHPVSSPLSA